MFYCTLLLNVILLYNVGPSVQGKHEEEFISKLRNDVNLDLSVDEEYEDLRAELLAYHTALASLTAGDERSSDQPQARRYGSRTGHGAVRDGSARRTLISTPCWEMGGICINYKLCSGFRYLTEVNGCRDKLMVCCFTWNRYVVRDWRDMGFGTLALPWSVKQSFGGEGIKEIVPPQLAMKKKKKRLKSNDTEAVAFIFRAAKK